MMLLLLRNANKAARASLVVVVVVAIVSHNIRFGPRRFGQIPPLYRFRLLRRGAGGTPSSVMCDRAALRCATRSSSLLCLAGVQELTNWKGESKNKTMIFRFSFPCAVCVCVCVCTLKSFRISPVLAATSALSPFTSCPFVTTFRWYQRRRSELCTPYPALVAKDARQQNTHTHAPWRNAPLLILAVCPSNETLTKLPAGSGVAKKPR